MSTYRQRVQALEQAQVLKAQAQAWNEAQDQKQMAMSPEECWQAGHERGEEDRQDGYTGAIERRTLGDDYAYPEEFRDGYRTAYYQDREENS